MIDAEKATYPVTMMCALLRVPRSTYYDWSARGHQVSPTAARRAELGVLVMEVFDEFLEVYGARRIARVLTERGHPVSPGTVAAADARPAPGRSTAPAYKVTTIHGEDDDPAPDLIGRDFTAAAPGQRLVGDITYLRTGEGWCYLATVIDLCTRMVVGWAIAAHMRTSLVTDALAMARDGGHLPAGAVFHSDRGTQYTSAEFATWCRDARHSPQRRENRDLLRQCGRGVILRNVEERDVLPVPIPHPRPGPIRGRAVHRAVLQPEATPLHPGLPHPRASPRRPPGRRRGGLTRNHPKGRPKNLTQLTQEQQGHVVRVRVAGEHP